MHWKSTAPLSLLGTLTARLLSIMATMTITRTAVVQGKDMFLFSGQSNMEGLTNSQDATFRNFMSDPSQFNDLVKILSDDPSLSRPWRRKRSLRQRIRKTENKAVASRMASDLMALYQEGLLDNMTDRVAGAECSFVAEDINKTVSGGTVPVSFDSKCGHDFGHEFLFSKSLRQHQAYPNDTVVHKAAVGGQKIDFFLNDYWPTLNQTIHQYAASPQGNLWKGFVWHQGTQDTHEGDSYLRYGDNLRRLVTQIRRELCRANALTLHISPDDHCRNEGAAANQIPVVIVQLGYWPQYDFPPHRPQVVREAQAAFCQADPRAQLVVTNDLSWFFHYDAASFVIAGHRIAQAMGSLLLQSSLDHKNAPCYFYRTCAEIPKPICQHEATCLSSCLYNQTTQMCQEHLSVHDA